MHILWLDNSDTSDKFVFYEAYRDDRNSPYTIVNRVRIDEIITDSSGLRSYKLPQKKVDRIERLLKGGDDSDIDSDDERVKNEEMADKDSSDEPPKSVFVSTRSRRSATRLQLFYFYNQTSCGHSTLTLNTRPTNIGLVFVKFIFDNSQL